MIEFELKPKEGISEIKFGMNRAEVRSTMESIYNEKGDAGAEYYFDNSLQFNYEDDTLSFIEIAIGHAPPFKLSIFKTAVHRVGEKRLFELLSNNDRINPKLSDENSPLFQKGIITLWRRLKNKKWESIGIGDDRYYKQCIELNKEYED